MLLHLTGYFTVLRYAFFNPAAAIQEKDMLLRMIYCLPLTK